METDNNVVLNGNAQVNSSTYVMNSTVLLLDIL